MEIRLPPEQEAQLAEIATQRGLKSNELAENVLKRYLEDDKDFIAAVNVGLAAAERGDMVDHEEVGKKLKEILRP
jgi:predicted transcriptional regulator